MSLDQYARGAAGRSRRPAAETGGAGARALEIGGRYGLLILLVAVVVLFSLWIPESFFSWDNFRGTLSQQAIILMVAFGVMLPLCVDEFDLSVGANAGFASVFCVGFAVLQGLPTWASLVLPILISTGIGLVNGLIVTKLKVMSFVATLGAATALLGFAQLYTDLQELRGAPDSLTNIGRTEIAGLPVPTVVALITAAVLIVVLQLLPVGREMDAIGANREAARLSGIRVDLTIVAVFAGAGLIVGVGGALYGANLGAASTTTGSTLLLPAFAGAFLGSTTIRPGQFNVLGTLIGVFLLAFTVSGLQQVGVPVWIESVVPGIALIVAVATSTWAIRARTARLRDAQLRSLTVENERAEQAA
ncbi:ABC transporter permease [Nocardioides hungaricus]